MKKLICIVLVAGCALAHAAKEPDAVDKAIERGLEFLLAAQKDNGSFTGQYGETVAIASLAGMSCLATGHVPGDAKYGKLIDRALERAVQYMHRHHHKEKGCFGYQNADQYPVTLSGAGILCLELCGKHEDPDSLRAAKYLMSVYRDKLPNEGYAYYGLYYASQGLFQIGGENWKEFSDWMYAEYLPRQRGSGAWPGHGSEQSEPNATAMTILAFAVPYRQLPVYQRDETVDE